MRRHAERDAKVCNHEGGEESAPPGTRTQPLIRRPDCLRHSGLPQGLGDDVRHTIHESLDFTPNGNRAERVQTVNVNQLSLLSVDFSAYFNDYACFARSSTLIRPRAAENVRSASASAAAP